MDTNESQTTTSFSFKNRQDWSNNAFAWFYAVLILISSVLFGFILNLIGIYESISLRIINVFIILGGFITLMWDYKQTKKKNLTYLGAFKLCVRTGFYFCLLFLPLLLIFLGNDRSELNLLQKHGDGGPHLTMMETVFWSYVEIVGSTLIAGLLASFIARFRN